MRGNGTSAQPLGSHLEIFNCEGKFATKMYIIARQKYGEEEELLAEDTKEPELSPVALIAVNLCLSMEETLHPCTTMGLSLCPNMKRNVPMCLAN